MTMAIFASAVLGVAAGYPLMKFELNSVQREKVRKSLDFASQGLAISIFILLFLLFKIPAALLIIALMAMASVRRGMAVIIFIAIAACLFGGEFGILPVLIGSCILFILLFFSYLYYRKTDSLKAITLELAGKKNKATHPNEENVNESSFLKRFVLKQSLHRTAFYCVLIVVLIEFSPLSVTTIQVLYSRNRALPYLVQAAIAGREGAEKEVVEYGKEALPLEMEILRHRLHNGWKYSPVTSGENSHSDVSQLTSMILEMGEAESLGQFGSVQKDVLRAAAIYSRRPINTIAVQELSKLKAIPELILLLDLEVAPLAMDALIQLPSSETIPLLMKWQIDTKKTLHSTMNGPHIISSNSYAGAFARYGESAVPVLIPYLGDESNVVSTLARDTLLLIGNPAIPALKQALHSENTRVVEQSTYVLSRISIERD